MSKEREIQATPQYVKVWKTSITKSELAELPAESVHGKITVIDDIESAKEAVKKLRSVGKIGFDTETKPAFRKGEHHQVALLQLSTPNECFLFRLNNIGLPECIIDILEDKNIVKIGLSIHDDFLSLNKRHKFEPAGFIELQSLVKEYGIDDISLSRIYGILFDKRISKGQRLTNWEAPVLSAHQQEYAALDAFACLTIYDYLNMHGFDYTKSKYYREFDEPIH